LSSRGGTPPLETQQKKGRKSINAQYDAQMLEFNNKRYTPSKIAKLIAQEHGLDSERMNRKTVESRLSYIKKNKLGALAPVNQKGRMRARDPPQNCQFFLFSFLFSSFSFLFSLSLSLFSLSKIFLFLFLTFLLGKQAAVAAGQLLSKTREEEEEEREMEEEATVEAINVSGEPACDDDVITDVDAVLRAHFFDAGLIYEHEGEETWNLFLARSFNYDVATEDPLAEGVMVVWNASGPTDEILMEAKVVTQCDVKEFEIFKLESKIFFPSPKPLCQDLSKVKKMILPADKEPKWLVVSISWHAEEPHMCASLMLLFYLQKTAQEIIQSFFSVFFFPTKKLKFQ
jgi:hypothetical protein